MDDGEPVDNTISEHDLDSATQQFVHHLREGDGEPDLAVDGLSDSLVSKLVRLLTFGRL